MRTESQQSFSLLSFSCSTNTSRLSSSCSSAWRVCEGGVCAKWCLFGKLKVDSPDGEEKTFDLYLCVLSSEIVCGQASYLHSL